MEGPQKPNQGRLISSCVTHRFHNSVEKCTIKSKEKKVKQKKTGRFKRSKAIKIFETVILFHRFFSQLCSQTVFGLASKLPGFSQD